MSAGHPPADGLRASAPYRAAFEKLIADKRYQENIHWGEPRAGHPEGALREHIADLERNAAALRVPLPEPDRWRLRLLIHAHDTFKPHAAEGARIADPRSHASLARAFLAEFCDDPDLLNLVQFHDEPYALWRQEQHGHLNHSRLDALFSVIRDWDLFLSFLIVDGSTAGKDRAPLRWFLGLASERVASSVTVADIL